MHMKEMLCEPPHLTPGDEWLPADEEAQECRPAVPKAVLSEKAQQFKEWDTPVVSSGRASPQWPLP